MWPGNVHVRGVHLHHEFFGMLLVLISGVLGFAVRTEAAWHDLLPLLFGTGAGLVLDEFAPADDPGFRLLRIGPTVLPAGTAVVADYTGTPTDATTGRHFQWEVRRYELWHDDQRGRGHPCRFR